MPRVGVRRDRELHAGRANHTEPEARIGRRQAAQGAKLYGFGPVTVRGAAIEGAEPAFLLGLHLTASIWQSGTIRLRCPSTHALLSTAAGQIISTSRRQ